MQMCNGVLVHGLMSAIYQRNSILPILSIDKSKTPNTDRQKIKSKK